MANLIADEVLLAYARMARAVALSKGDFLSARAFIEANHGANSIPYRLVQRDIDGTGSIVDDSTARLASTGLLGVSPRSNLLGQINAASGGLLQVGFNSRFLLQDSGATGAWVGEGTPLPVSGGGLSLHSLDVLKVGSLYFAPIEQMRTFGPVADLAIARGLSAGNNAEIAKAFADPANAGVPGEKPASVTADATVIASSGSSAADLSGDMAEMIEAFDGDLASAVWLMNPGLAFAFGMMGAGIGAADLMTGGVSRLAGLPAIANQGVPANTLILLDPSSVAVAGPVIDIDPSTEAAVEMQIEGGGSEWLNLWQENPIGARSIAYVNWTARPGAAVVLGGVFPAAAVARGK
ncbi:hypothetical protein SAMN05446927_7421 [Caballeronia arationis]|uniref:Peptidase C31 domain-containing protein n=1 Tax=Caballeronia arationis TaxID=1777142 RepID=A0A7Z7N7A8_9BURK|nr:hypothetical protein [Caballeronia arationis]SOE88798.1 hypothetical protein SAMN05446927_7421 [Caballeronia arationis]